MKKSALTSRSLPHVSTHLKILDVLLHKVRLAHDHHRAATGVQVSAVQLIRLALHREWGTHLYIPAAENEQCCDL